jgi:hypothetical protein
VSICDNPTIVGSIVNCGSRFFGLTGHICGVRVSDREGHKGSHYDNYVIYDDKIFMVDSK